MDRGAARSRKRAEQLERAALRAKEEEAKARKAQKSGSKPSRPGKDKQDGGRPNMKSQKKAKTPAEPQSRDPELYKPKAIRSATALVWSNTPFPLDSPPSAESLANITRVDLGGSGITNVEFLRGSGVTWLSLVDCPIQDWSPLGTLKELAG